ncbi:MAG: hypothetical protein OEV28_13645 [Nitrospirota bacterium]|nr:hypothetical protein [Nitrospirota bacterium]
MFTTSATAYASSPMIKKLVGKTVIILPVGYEGADVRYQHLRKDFGAAAEAYPAKELALKKAKVVEYKEAEGSTFPVRFYLKLEVEGGGTAWYVDQGSGEFLKEMVLASQVEEAGKWVNRSVWVKNAASLNLFKDSPMTVTSGGHSEELLKVRNTEKLTLGHVDITNSGLLPFLFRVKTEDGKDGFLVVGGDVSENLGRRFYLKDPKKENKWSEAIWKYIEEGRVQIGMTEEQVGMAWGEADWRRNDEKAANIRVLAYDVYRLHFENGKLVSMSEEKAPPKEKSKSKKEKNELPSNHP